MRSPAVSSWLWGSVLGPPSTPKPQSPDTRQAGDPPRLVFTPTWALEPAAPPHSSPAAGSGGSPLGQPLGEAGAAARPHNPPAQNGRSPPPPPPRPTTAHCSSAAASVSSQAREAWEGFVLGVVLVTCSFMNTGL